MKILFVYQDSGKSIYLESLTHHLKQKGIEVEAVFLCPKGHLQEQLEKQGVKCGNYCTSKKHIIPKMLFYTATIIRVSREIKPNLVVSSLVYANLYTAIASYFLGKISVITCRHNADEFYREGNKRGIFLDKVVNFLSPKILVVSQKAKEHLIEVEKVKAGKVHFLPLAYDFKRYKKAEKELVTPKSKDIKLRVLFISRLVAIKRIDRFFPLIKHFKEKNIKIEMHIIGDGPLEKSLKERVRNLDLEDLVMFLGHKNNVISYIETADLVVNLSISESSNQVVKEAGFCEKTVIACKEVGDFGTYLNETNAYLLEKSFSDSDLITTFDQIFQDLIQLKMKGENLKKTVLNRFSFQDKIVNQYLAFFA
jgi:glycosyltransferase involved in cell wall biosynthesis